MQCPDGALVVILDQVTYPAHELGELVAGEIRSSPDGAHQLVSAYGAVPVANQIDQRLENLRWNAVLLSPRENLAPGWDQAERTEEKEELVQPAPPENIRSPLLIT